MELRSGRSKSKTPIHSFNYDQKIIEGENHIGQTVITRKSTTTTKTEYMGDIDNIVSYNHESSVKPSKLKSSKSEKAVRKTRYKTSDYSSEDGEPQITSTYYYDQNSANEFFEEPSRSVSRSSGSQVSALDFYRAAGDYWNKYPKTDYTYSLNSKDRTEIAPGVVAMPNMSRKSLHNFNSNSDYISTDKYTSTDYDESYDTRYVSKSMYTAKPRTLFSNNGYSTTTTVKKKSFLKIFTVFTSIFSWISTLVYYIYKTQNSAVLWVAKKIHTAATKVMLWDTWILQSFREKRKLSLLLLLCFLPLLLLGGWWLLSGLVPLFNGNQDTKSAPVLPSDSVINHFEHNYKPEAIDSVYTNSEDSLQNQLLINDLKEEINKIKIELSHLETNQNNEIVKILAENRAQLNYELNRCCRNSFNQIESYVTKIVKDLMGVPPHFSTEKDISSWIHSTFVAKQELEKHLHDFSQNLNFNYTVLIENNEKFLMDKVLSEISKEISKRIADIDRSKITGTIDFGSITDEHIRRIVLDSLAIYDADKTGLVDYALESAGGEIISTRCTESYQARTAVFTVFGIPVWYPSNTPRTVITSGLVPGECWAFQNFPGFLLVKLAAPIRIEVFSIEHVSKLLTPNGKIDSAPKEFAVYGLKNETDKEPVLLGQYVYDREGPPLQYFEAMVRNLVFNIVELRINSNHGNPNYTCLYRFRVHGSLASEPL